MNRVLRAVRDFGTVPHVTEIRLDHTDAAELLRHWKAELSDDGVVWRSLMPPSAELPWGLFMTSLGIERVPELHASKWPQVVEAIEDDLASGPEREFLVNALEHTRVGDLRLAVVETIICLEIILSQFLREYLGQVKGLSKVRIDGFLKPELGLSIRLAALLDLTLPTDAIRGVDLNAVQRVVQWRNEIVHKTGRLPSGIAQDVIRASISQVLVLALNLARRRDAIVVEPELRELSRRLTAELNLKMPLHIQSSERHSVIVSIVFMLPTDIPQGGDLNAMVETIGRRLRERDPRFVPGDHLSIEVSDVLKNRHARWAKGQWEMATREAKTRL